MGFYKNQYLQNFSYILYFIYFLNFILFYTTLSLLRFSFSYIIRETLRYFQKYMILIDTCICFKYILKQIIVSGIFQVLICMKHSSKCFTYIDVFNSYKNFYSINFSLVTQSCPTLQSQGLQHARLPCPSPTSGAYSNSCPLSRWCYPIISSSVILFSFCRQFFPASGSFQMNQFFTLDG